MSSTDPKRKSILDNFPVDETMYHVKPPVRKILQEGSSSGDQLEIVGSCCCCGSPIYGNKILHYSELKTQSPVVARSCNCPPQNKSIQNLMETK